MLYILLLLLLSLPFPVDKNQRFSSEDSYFNDVSISAIIDADEFIRNKPCTVPIFEGTYG